MKATSVLKIIGWIVLGIAGIAALGLVLGLAVMWLWNWLMPAIFHLPEITYWQAVGLTVLCHMLFKSHLHPGHGHPHDENHSKLREKIRCMLHGKHKEPEATEAA